MINTQLITDKAAISLSLLCAVHCLAFPTLVILLPSLAALPLEDEAFHLWMVIVVIPISAYALTMGCKKHKRYRVALLGTLGLTILAGAAFIGEETLGETWEKTLTVIGATIIVLGHFWNYRLCSHPSGCTCPEHES